MILLEGEQCYLRILEEEDAEKVAELFYTNRVYWTVYEPRHEPGFYRPETQRQKIRESLYQMKDRREYNFGVFHSQTSQLIGHISLYNIKRLPFSSGFIGYSIDEGHTKKGIGVEIVKIISHFAFSSLQLHRVEAYVSPHNIGSIKVLERNQYQREGLLRQNLYINSVWEDHYLYSLLAEDLGI